jgi:carbonic anhydrase
MTTLTTLCNSTTTPLNISIEKQSGKCDSKCDYSFNYHTSSCNVTNNDTYISIAYDGGNATPVKYNSQGYNVTAIRIYSPSVHTFMGKQAHAEIVIIHSPVKGGNNLIVCVPVKSNETAITSKGSVLINGIIKGTTINAPKSGETATLNLIKSFSLNSVVPSKSFFSYTGTDTFYNCAQTVNYIVFTPVTSDISLVPLSAFWLKKIIVPSNIVAKQPSKTTPLFINDNGPSNADTNDGIYLDCQPVDQSTETSDVVVTNNYDPSPIDAKDIFNNVYFKFIGIFILVLILIMISSRIFNFFSPAPLNININKPFGLMSSKR